MAYKIRAVIYFIKNLTNNKIYVGSTCDWVERKKQHKYMLRHNCHYNTHLQNSWNLYNEKNFEFDIIEELSGIEITGEILETREQIYIDLYKSHLRKNGYNLNPNAKNCKGRKHSEETKNKIAKSHIGMKASLEAKKSMREAKLGMHQTQPHILNRIKKLKNFYKSGSGNKGKFGHPNSKSIIQLTLNDIFVKRWNSSLEIYREIGLNPRNIRACCSGGKRKKAHGYKWKFETE